MQFSITGQIWKVKYRIQMFPVAPVETPSDNRCVQHLVYLIVFLSMHMKSTFAHLTIQVVSVCCVCEAGEQMFSLLFLVMTNELPNVFP